MKIKRKRKGFTTNSSSASEWVPGTGTPSPIPSSNPLTRTTSSLKPGETIVSKPVPPPSTTNNTSTTNDPSGSSIPAAWSSPLINGSALALLFSGVAITIILERKIRKKKK